MIVREALPGCDRSRRERTRKRERRIEGGVPAAGLHRISIIVERHPNDPRFRREATQALVTAGKLRRFFQAPEPRPSPTRVDLSVRSADEWAVYQRLHARVIGHIATGVPATPDNPPVETETR